MGKIKNKIKEKNGFSDFIVLPIILIILTLFITLFIDLYTPYIKRINLNTFARELVREIEIYGNIGTEANERIKELEQSLGIKPTITYSKTGTLTLNEKFTVKFEYSLKTPFWKLPFNFSLTVTGRSEIYRKE